MKKDKKLTEVSWHEFRMSGLLWWVNRILHTFGYTIICDYSDDTGKFNRAYPAKCTYRGFDNTIEKEGFELISKNFIEKGEDL